MKQPYLDIITMYPLKESQSHPYLKDILTSSTEDLQSALLNLEVQYMFGDLTHEQETMYRIISIVLLDRQTTLFCKNTILEYFYKKYESASSIYQTHAISLHHTREILSQDV